MSEIKGPLSLLKYAHERRAFGKVIGSVPVLGVSPVPRLVEVATGERFFYVST